MAKTIEQLLGLPALMGLVEETTNGLPQEEWMPKEFTNLKQEVIGNQVEATLAKGQRKTSRTIRYNSVPVGAPLETIGTQDWICMHSSEQQDIDPVTFQRLRNYGDWSMQKLGMEEIGRQIGLFVQKQANLESSALLFALTSGNVWFDSQGNLLPTSSGALDTTPIGVPSSNQGQLNYGGGNLITAPWNQPSANIPNDVRNVVLASLQATGYRIKYALYGKNLPSYIMSNSYCRDYLSKNPAMNAALMTTNEIPDGFLNLMWRPAWESFFEDGNGTNQKIMGDDCVTFMPVPDKRWYQMTYGSMQIPTTIDIQTNVNSAMSNIEIKYGRYSYAQLQALPIRLVVVTGNTFFPTIKVPAVLWQSTVVY